MLRRVKIEGYKSLADVEVTLQPLTLLFGPNAAGKSNFLDALQLLSRLATSRTLKEAFEPPYRGKPLESFRFGQGGLEALLTQDSVAFSIEVDVDLSNAVVEAVDRQIREMRPTRTSADDHVGNGAKGPALVRERHLRYRIEVEILPKSGILPSRRPFPDRSWPSVLRGPRCRTGKSVLPRSPFGKQTSSRWE